jgi:glycosyltransferase involved in cell wall biosynthesis
MEDYDFVYLTNTPSFYKLNLCNEIAKSHRLLLVLYGYGEEAVNKELGEGSGYRFDYYFLNNGDSNKRSKIKTFWNLLRLMGKIRVSKIIYAGWLAPEYNLYSFFSEKRKNIMVCESSIFDASFQGIAGFVKKIIIGRMSAVLPSGQPQDELFKSIGFKGQRNITGGVGLFYKPKKTAKIIHKPLRYLYVGRLIEVKNIKLLIDEFNRNGHSLTIVGKGVLEEKLKADAQSNITFMGFIDNENLGTVYQNHDVFVLPSKSETWGLVVEEAIYWGLPVIVSDRVGCGIDMVKDLGTGKIFESESMDSLHSAIIDMERNFDTYRHYVDNVDWNERDKKQVEAYFSLLKNQKV